MQTPPPNYSQYPRGPQGLGSMGYRGPGVYFDFISEAFRMIQKNLAVYVVGGLLVLMIPQVIQMPLSFLNNYLIYGGLTPKYRPDGFPDIHWQYFPFIVFLYMFNYGLQETLGLGISMCAIEEADTGQTVLNTMFSRIRYFLPILITLMICQILILIGTLLFIVPGLYLMGALSLAPVFVIKEEMQPIEAIKKSLEVTKPHAFMLFLLVLVASLASGLGVFACCIGLVFTIPIKHIVLGLTYREFRGPISTGFQLPQAPMGQ